MDNNGGSSAPSPQTWNPRIVCLSLHLPDPVPDNAGVSYLRHLVDAVGADDVLVIAPDAPMNRRSASQVGVGAHRLVPARVSRGIPGLEKIQNRMARICQISPPRGFLEAVLADPETATMLKNAEIIDLQWPGMSALASRVRQHAPDARVIATLHDVSSQRLERQAQAARSAPQRLRLWVSRSQAKWVERHELAKADTVVVFSEKDRELLPSNVRVTVVNPPISAPNWERRYPTQVPTVTVVGPLTRPENWDAVSWLVADIWPTVNEAIPDARLVIAGNVNDEQRALLSASRGVEVRGFVEDLEALYAETNVAAAPIRYGAGVKFKALEALLRGIPLVATSVGVEGIGDGDYLPESHDDSTEFANALIDALNQSPDSVRSARRAQKWAEARFSVAAFSREIAALYGPDTRLGSAIGTCSESHLIASVIIPVFNGEHGLARQLSSLARQPEARNIEVVIADNGSTDRTSEVALAYRQAFADLRVVDAGDRRGASHARNVGIATARADKLLFCDHDDEVRAGWVAALVAQLDVTDIAGGRTISSAVSGAHRALESVEVEARATRETFGHLRYALAGCMGVRRSVAIEVGGFDETLRGHEEADFSWRIQHAGYTLGEASDAVLDYHQRDRAIDAARQRFVSAQSRIQLWERHHESQDLDGISFKGSIKHLIRTLPEFRFLINGRLRFVAARDLGWAIGTVQGHLRYRFFGSAPRPVLMDSSGTIPPEPTSPWSRQMYAQLQQIKHHAFVATKPVRRQATRLGNTAVDLALKSFGKWQAFEFDATRYPGEFVAETPPTDGDTAEAPRRITLLWLGKQELSQNRRRGLASVSRLNPGIEVQLVAEHSIASILVDGHPLHPAFQYLALTHQSDYLRCYIMHLHGGGYCDVKTISHSWAPAFRRLNAEPTSWALGYRELSHTSVSALPGRIQDDLRANYFRVIGNGAFIMKPNTPLTTEWFAEIHRRLDRWETDLQKSPGGVRGGEEGGSYPVPKHALLGDILGPLALKYHDHLILDDSVRPSFTDYL